MSIDTSKIPVTRLCMDNTPTSGSDNLITSGASAGYVKITYNGKA